MRNIMLKLCYDGTDYHGFQRQENGITIQQVVEEAIKKVTCETVTITGCSRTDAGVHAMEYVCNFKTESTVPEDKFCFAINSYMPEGISCTASKEVSEDFHSRYSAKSKTYVYSIYNAPHKNPILCRFAWHYPIKIDVEKMKVAAVQIVGTHDFTAFMASGGQQKTTVKTVNFLDITQDENQIFISINADGFLYNMVRIIAGTLVYAGTGKLAPESILDIIKSGDRTLAGITAPPQGLCLKEIFY